MLMNSILDVLLWEDSNCSLRHHLVVQFSLLVLLRVLLLLVMLPVVELACVALHSFVAVVETHLRALNLYSMDFDWTCRHSKPKQLCKIVTGEWTNSMAQSKQQQRSQKQNGSGWEKNLIKQRESCASVMRHFNSKLNSSTNLWSMHK